MELAYTTAKEKGSSRYYVHRVGDPAPISGTYGEKKQVMHTAAKMNGITYKEFMRLRKRED